jgi:hypothetical protein
MIEFKTPRFVHCVRLNMPDDNRLISGLDTNGSNTQITFTAYGASDTVVPAVYAYTTASVLVGAGKQIQVNY